MAKLLIQTQVFENYGAHDWDGTGECPQYWKAKGGSDYVVKNVTNDIFYDVTMKAIRDQIERSDDYYRESVIYTMLVADDYLTDFERSQLEYEGKIAFPAIELQV